MTRLPLPPLLHATLALMALCAGLPSNAATVFSANFVAAGTQGFAGSGHYFQAGDSASQTYTGTGLAAVQEVDLHLHYTSDVNALNPVFDVLINGSKVGSFLTDYNADLGGSWLDLAFGVVPQIDGNGTWTLEMSLENDVGVGNGSVYFGGGGDYLPTMKLVGIPSTQNSVPEPATLALSGLALAGLWLGGRRRATGPGATR